MTMLLHGTETLQAAVDRIYREQTDRDLNVVRDRDVVAALTEWLGEDHARITTSVVVNAAQKAKNDYLKAHRPNMLGGQLSLFQPHYLIPLGKGLHAWLDFASREQVLEWVAVLTTAFERTKATHDERIRQIMERLDRWGNHATFGQVERAEFGWTRADFRYGAGDDDDEGDDE
jgi:hypothetical protein